MSAVESGRAPGHAGASRRTDWLLTRGVGLLLLCLGVLPVAAWIPGGLRDPLYTQRWIEWGYGSLICVGVGIVSAIVTRRFHAAAAQQGAALLRLRLAAFPVATDAAVAIGCGVIYAALARTVFAGRPLLIDEIVQVLQARMYATGQVSAPVSAWPEFFSVLHVVDTGPRVYSQFPPGWPAMLALGSLVHAEWLVGPACGAVAVFAFARFLRRFFSPGETLSVLAGTLLFGLAPFGAFQFASHMSHGPVLMWLVLSVLALSHTVSDDASRSHAALWSAMTGLCAGVAFAVRPLDAVAFGLVAGAWLVWRAVTDRTKLVDLAWAAAGLGVPVAAVMWVNVLTTGSPTVFGYQVLWGSAHGLGFHPAPWGDAHTPQRGLELLSLYVTRLNAYFLETPFPSLLPAVFGLVTWRRLTGIERFLIVGTGVHGLLYFAYWHDGFYLGPRFVVPWIPLLVLACVRGGQRLAAARLNAFWRTGTYGALAAGVVLTVAIAIPARSAQYRAGLVSMREDYAGEALRAGARDAIVFVHESWGAQLVARFWALGISRSATDALYTHTDACVLEHSIAAAERGVLRGAALESSLRHLLADSLRVVPSTVSPDTTERMMPGSVYDDLCSTQVRADQDGYALYPPFLLDNVSGNMYVRDFGARDSVILGAYPGRPAFVVTRNGVDGTSPLHWRQVR